MIDIINEKFTLPIRPIAPFRKLNVDIRTVFETPAEVACWCCGGVIKFMMRCLQSERETSVLWRKEVGEKQITALAANVARGADGDVAERGGREADYCASC